MSIIKFSICQRNRHQEMLQIRLRLAVQFAQTAVIEEKFKALNTAPYHVEYNSQ